MQDTATQPLSIGQENHHRHQSPYDPQHREDRAKPVAHQRLPALRDELFEEHRWVIVRPSSFARAVDAEFLADDERPTSLTEYQYFPIPSPLPLELRLHALSPVTVCVPRNPAP